VFTWISLPAKKTAGGILVGIRDDDFEVIAHSFGIFHISVVIRNRNDSFVWQLVTIYGTAYADKKLDFFTELHDIMDNNSLPILFGGDFNLVRQALEKSNENINAQWVFLFNDWINKWNLIELKTANRLFTWSNNQDVHIFATLDRVLASITWEQKFPLSSIQALPRLVSDHTPLLLDSGHNKKPPPPPEFSVLKNGG
jgi:hypothetical protein